MMAETAARAASQHEVYQELMFPPGVKAVDALARKVGWDDDFGQLEQKLIAAGLPKSSRTPAPNFVRTKPSATRSSVAARRRLMRAARSNSGFFIRWRAAAPRRSLRGDTRGLSDIGRRPSIVTPDPHMVGLNLVMPEDWYVPMKDFSLHMQMLGYLHQRYPKVHISLHAGELVQGLVPPEGLRFHIRDSVEIAHAERIGHGVDLLNETNPAQLLRELAAKNVMVEICLTSNAVILNVTDPHPLREYMREGVPVALATDDEGVSRSDMTHEFLRGAMEQKLSYVELKKMARTSLEHAFLPGASLWRDDKSFVVVSECAKDVPGTKPRSVACDKLLQSSEKAQLQWKLEAEFAEFEQQQPWLAAPPRKPLARRDSSYGFFPFWLVQAAWARASHPDLRRSRATPSTTCCATSQTRRPGAGEGIRATLPYPCR